MPNDKEKSSENPDAILRELAERQKLRLEASRRLDDDIRAAQVLVQANRDRARALLNDSRRHPPSGAAARPAS